MQVRELMSTEVVTVGLEATLADAADRLLNAGVGSVIVVEDGEPVGIVTESDVLRAARDTGNALRDIDVREVGHGAVVTTSPSKAVTTVARLMADEGVKKVPVMDGLDLVGMVTLTDIVWALPSLRAETTAMEAVRDRWSPS
ncbi:MULTISPECIES: CBS domain-containing protein [Haloarcula]|uniref:CBS domain-containing protein n=1 Tax=Haloarcula TaxID=2237 RepID=UPI0023E76E93|nr:CBS domain-containing protein [Halomicroarcula sp. SHR3]